MASALGNAASWLVAAGQATLSALADVGSTRKRQLEHYEDEIADERSLRRKRLIQGKNVGCIFAQFERDVGAAALRSPEACVDLEAFVEHSDRLSFSFMNGMSNSWLFAPVLSGVILPRDTPAYWRAKVCVVLDYSSIDASRLRPLRAIWDDCLVLEPGRSSAYYHNKSFRAMKILEMLEEIRHATPALLDWPVAVDQDDLVVFLAAKRGNEIAQELSGRYGPLDAFKEVANYGRPVLLSAVDFMARLSLGKEPAGLYERQPNKSEADVLTQLQGSSLATVEKNHIYFRNYELEDSWSVFKVFSRVDVPLGFINYLRGEPFTAATVSGYYIKRSSNPSDWMQANRLVNNKEILSITGIIMIGPTDTNRKPQCYVITRDWKELGYTQFDSSIDAYFASERTSSYFVRRKFFHPDWHPRNYFYKPGAHYVMTIDWEDFQPNAESTPLPLNEDETPPQLSTAELDSTRVQGRKPPAAVRLAAASKRLAPLDRLLSTVDVHSGSAAEREKIHEKLVWSLWSASARNDVASLRRILDGTQTEKPLLMPDDVKRENFRSLAYAEANESHDALRFLREYAQDYQLLPVT